MTLFINNSLLSPNTLIIVSHECHFSHVLAVCVSHGNEDLPSTTVEYLHVFQALHCRAETLASFPVEFVYSFRHLPTSLCFIFSVNSSSKALLCFGVKQFIQSPTTPGNTRNLSGRKLTEKICQRCSHTGKHLVSPGEMMGGHFSLAFLVFLVMTVMVAY